MQKITINSEDLCTGRLESLFRTRIEWKNHVSNILVAHGGKCDICGRKLDAKKKNGKYAKLFHVHHRYESFTMGEYMNLEPSRFMLLCPVCHEWVHRTAGTLYIADKYFVRLPKEQARVLREHQRANRGKKCGE